MGLANLGFSGGREDIYEPDGTYWGPETTWLGDNRVIENELADPFWGDLDGFNLRKSRRASWYSRSS